MSKRLRREMEDFKNTIEEDIHVVPFENSLFKLNAYIRGPQDTPYENGIYHLEVVISNTYPMVPPVFRFITKVFHPNIYFKVIDKENEFSWNVQIGWNDMFGYTETRMVAGVEHSGTIQESINVYLV